MATKVVGVLKELEVEKKCYGSPNKLVEDDSASRPARKIFLAKEKGSASRVGKVLDFGENEASGGNKPARVVKVASTNKKKAASSNKKATEPVEEDSASRFAGKLVPCKICVAKGEDGGCYFCVAKAAALEHIEAAGGDIVEAAAAAEKKCKTKPFCVVDVSALKRMEEAGGRIIKEVSKEGVVGKVATVRVPDASLKRLMNGRLPRPLSPLPADYFQEYPQLRESTQVIANAVLYTVMRKENVLAQFYERGYAVVDFEVVDSYYQ